MKEVFVENGIEVFIGVDGQSDTAAQQYAKGLLKSTGTICTEHDH